MPRIGAQVSPFMVIAAAGCSPPQGLLAPELPSENARQRSSSSQTIECKEAQPQQPLPRLPQLALSRLEMASFDKSLCSDLTANPKFLESCAIHLLANGTALRVMAISKCGAHACNVESFLFTEGRKAFVTESYGPSTWEVTPDHRYLLRGDFSYSKEEPGEETPLPAMPSGFVTTRTDLDTGEETPFAQCISPALSPSGKWIVCRGFDGSVARIPTEGGTLEVVIQTELDQENGLKLHGPFNDYPGAVVFLSETRIRYELYLRNEEVLHLEAPWTE